MARAEPRDAPTKRRFSRRTWFWLPAGVVAVLVPSLVLAFKLSPWPGALVIRSFFAADAAKTKEALEAYAPPGVASIADQRYRAGDGDALLDVYFPETSDRAGVRLPTLIWTHGGAWVSGQKDDVAPYLRLIAAEGYTVVSLGYSLGPGHTYPTPVRQVNDALAFVQQHADRFHVDVDRIFMGGDSAGAQIASQYAVLVTNPAYAAELGLTPTLQPAHLRGLILQCGIYDLRTFWERANLTGGGDLTSRILGWGSRTVVRAYTGHRRPDDVLLRQMSITAHVTADFPPAFISGGNGDPLTDDQSRPLAAKLQGLGVPVSALFYPKDHEPALGHLYQFKLDTADGQHALTQTLTFLKQHAGA